MTRKIKTRPGGNLETYLCFSPYRMVTERGRDDVGATELKLLIGSVCLSARLYTTWDKKRSPAISTRDPSRTSS